MRQVDALAEMDRMPKGLKTHNRANQLIFDSAWIAGVDYDEEAFEDNDFNKNFEDEDDGFSDDVSEYDDEYDELDPNELEDIINEREEIMADENENQNEQRDNEILPALVLKGWSS